MRYDAAVVGSGPNGLVAAITLARSGRSVIVYEAGESIGGGARTRELTRPGFAHDICSAIHPMGIGSPALRDLPLERHGLEWVHPAAPVAHPMDDGTAVVMHRSMEATAANLDASDRDRYAAWYEPFVDRWEALFGDALAPLGIPRNPLLMARFGLRAFRAATELARGAFEGPRARALFAGLAGHSVLPLERPPSAAIGLMLGIAAHAVGWPIPRGGSQSISDALAAHLRELGGEITTGCEVGALDDVSTDGPVLCDTSPATMAAIAGDALPPGYTRRLAEYRYGPGVFKLDWALSAAIPWTAPDCAKAGTVHLGGTLEEIAASERCPWQGEHALRPYVLVAQQSLFDDTRAPAGHHTGWAYCHVPSDSTVDMTSAIEAQVERYAPGFRDIVIERHTMNTRDFVTYNANYVGGDINGGAADIDQLFTRPVVRLSPYSTPNPRIWLCSSATPPGGGVHGMCGYHAAMAVLRKHP